MSIPFFYDISLHDIFSPAYITEAYTRLRTSARAQVLSFL
jgi:hypothetical protein